MSVSLGRWIKVARKFAGISLDELSFRIDGLVSAQSISKYERGIMEPHSDVLVRIASALSMPENYFLRPEIILQACHFRLDGNIEDGSILCAENAVRHELELLFALRSMLNVEFVFSNPIADMSPVSNGKDVEWIVELLRGRWNIGCQPIHSVYQLLESYGIQLVETDFGHNSIDGISFLACGNIPVIAINTGKAKTVERKRFTALHELGHLLLSFSANSDDAEKLCHRFANAMLIPMSQLIRETGTKREKLTLGELVSIRNTYGISVAATVHRLHDLEVIGDDYYHHIFENRISQNQMEMGWGGYSVPEVPRQFKMLLHRAVAEQLVPASTLERFGADGRGVEMLNDMVM